MSRILPIPCPDQILQQLLGVFCNWPPHPGNSNLLIILLVDALITGATAWLTEDTDNVLAVMSPGMHIFKA